MSSSQDSRVSATSEESSLFNMLAQFDRKIAEISNLKNQIRQKVQNNQQLKSNRKQSDKNDKYWQTGIANKILQLSNYCKKQMLKQIHEDIQQYNNQRIETTMNIINYYEGEIKKYKAYYQVQMEDLREEIKRQYKVIAMMKQQVQDLMILMKYKAEQDASEQTYCNSTDKQISENGENAQERSNSEVKNNKLKLNELESRERSCQLDVIEQQTERTIYSSERSVGNHQQQYEVCTPFIKIEEDQVEPRKLVFKDKEEEDELALENNQFQQNLPKQLNQHLKAQQISKYRKRQSGIHSDQLCQQLIPHQIDDGIQCLHICNNESMLHVNYVRMHEENTQAKNNLMIVSKEQNKGQPTTNKKQKNNSAESSRVDHLQSIFFLDEECQPLSKTDKLCNFRNINLSQNGQQQKKYMRKSLQQNHLLQITQNKNNTIDKVQQKPFHKKKHSAYEYEPDNTNNLSIPEQLQYHNKSRQEAQCNKENKSYKQMTEQQANEFIFKKFNKVINIGQFQTSASMPVSTKNDLINQVPPHNNSEHTSHRNLADSKPKTKQFLQQFRKTFTKCLSSLQTSKKNSSKTLHSSNSNSKHHGKQHASYLQNQLENSQSISSQIIFCQSNSNSHHPLHQKQDHIRGKQNIESTHKQKQSLKQHKQNSMKVVVSMLKQLQNNNKFVTGGKKIQLKYEGEKKNGIRNGNGILYYSNGLCYDGQFKDGLRHGYGTLKFNHIEIYNGDWVNDQIQGEGRIRNCAIINKRKSTPASAFGPLGKWISYSGQFKNSKFEGQGTLHLQGGQKFVGTFLNGYANGQGSICKKNGDLEYGIWQNSMMVTRHTDK